jgi:hypothetical protein
MRVDVPNLMAFARLLLSVGVLFLLVYLRPYVYVRTFWLDVACYVCLIVQFGLQGFSANRDFMGVAESSFRAGFFAFVSIWSTAFRLRVLLIVRLSVAVSQLTSLLLQIFPRRCLCCGASE